VGYGYGSSCWMLLVSRGLSFIYNSRALKAFYKAVYKRGAAGQRRAEEGTQD
jgi:hypothetical protein